MIKNTKDILIPILHSTTVSVILSILSAIFGGLDDVFLTLLGLMFVDNTLNMITHKVSIRDSLKTDLKVLLVIFLGIQLDRLLGLTGNTVNKSRTYLILSYSYNEMLNIIDFLSEDDTFYIPSFLRKLIKKMSSRNDESGGK